MKHTLFAAAALLSAMIAAPCSAEPDIAKYLGAEPQTFPDEKQAVEALKTGLLAKDVPGLARLIGLNPDEIGKTEGFDERLTDLQDAAQERLHAVDDGADRRVILLGELVWPFPFPLVKEGDAWHFDTEEGLEEILNRRIGENELETIRTARNYILAQDIYRAEDWDGDGVLEYAQALKSPPGTKDGLYWPASEDGWESPAGAFADDAKLEGAPASSDGYFGYRYRILNRQGDNIAGGAYDYVINGNMIAGFGLLAWPAKYGETGVKTFAVNQHGIVYETDLGSATGAVVKYIERFNPDDAWEMVSD